MDRFSLFPLGALDLDRAAAIHGEAFAELGERAWTRQDFAGLLGSPGAGGFLLVDRSGAGKGCGSGEADAGIALHRIAADEAELLTLAVRTSFRRAGAGRLLLRAAIERVKEEGARMLLLEVGADNPAALSLYRSEGFHTVGGRVAYYRRGEGPPADALIMRLNLS